MKRVDSYRGRAVFFGGPVGSTGGAVVAGEATERGSFSPRCTASAGQCLGVRFLHSQMVSLNIEHATGSPCSDTRLMKLLQSKSWPGNGSPIALNSQSGM
eukprot:FR737172.1.p3 GENE.FR737172.1~~FR737172.1.p3  ORF type:complete len:100 (-),score=7.08 FR737172.1:420-719(-)